MSDGLPQKYGGGTLVKSGMPCEPPCAEDVGTPPDKKQKRGSTEGLLGAIYVPRSAQNTARSPLKNPSSPIQQPSSSSPIQQPSSSPSSSAIDGVLKELQKKITGMEELQRLQQQELKEVKELKKKIAGMEERELQRAVLTAKNVVVQWSAKVFEKRSDPIFPADGTLVRMAQRAQEIRQAKSEAEIPHMDAEIFKCIKKILSRSQEGMHTIGAKSFEVELDRWARERDVLLHPSDPWKAIADFLASPDGKALRESTAHEKKDADSPMVHEARVVLLALISVSDVMTPPQQQQQQE